MPIGAFPPPNRARSLFPMGHMPIGAHLPDPEPVCLPPNRACSLFPTGRMPIGTVASHRIATALFPTGHMPIGAVPPRRIAPARSSRRDACPSARFPPPNRDRSLFPTGHMPIGAHLPDPEPVCLPPNRACSLFPTGRMPIGTVASHRIATALFPTGHMPIGAVPPRRIAPARSSRRDACPSARFPPPNRDRSLFPTGHMPIGAHLPDPEPVCPPAESRPLALPDGTHAHRCGCPRRIAPARFPTGRMPIGTVAPPAESRPRSSRRDTCPSARFVTLPENRRGAWK